MQHQIIQLTRSRLYECRSRVFISSVFRRVSSWWQQRIYSWWFIVILGWIERCLARCFRGNLGCFSCYWAGCTWACNWWFVGSKTGFGMVHSVRREGCASGCCRVLLRGILCRVRLGVVVCWLHRGCLHRRMRCDRCCRWTRTWSWEQNLLQGRIVRQYFGKKGRLWENCRRVLQGQKLLRHRNAVAEKYHENG